MHDSTARTHPPTLLAAIVLSALCLVLGSARVAEALVVDLPSSYAHSGLPEDPGIRPISKNMIPWTGEGCGVHVVFTFQTVSGTTRTINVSGLSKEGTGGSIYIDGAYQDTFIGRQPHRLPEERWCKVTVDGGSTYEAPYGAPLQDAYEPGSDYNMYSIEIPGGLGAGHTVEVEIWQRLNSTDERLEPDVECTTVPANSPSDGAGSSYVYGGSSWSDRGNVFEVRYLSDPLYPSVQLPISQDPGADCVYRIYNVSNGEHLYTKDSNEANTLQLTGWTYERVGWNAPKTSDEPIYRLFNQWSGEHLYTTDRNEYDTLDANGWNGEGVKLYSSGEGGVPTYRLRNPWGSGVTAHHYTNDANERATLLKAGYEDEGVAWYGL